MCVSVCICRMENTQHCSVESGIELPAKGHSFTHPEEPSSENSGCDLGSSLS